MTHGVRAGRILTRTRMQGVRSRGRMIAPAGIVLSGKAPTGPIPNIGTTLTIELCLTVGVPTLTPGMSGVEVGEKNSSLLPLRARRPPLLVHVIAVHRVLVLWQYRNVINSTLAR